VRLLKKKKTQECIQLIAFWLNLPVRIDLTYVPRPTGPSPSFRAVFGAGRADRRVAAQVSIPRDTPAFNDPALRDFPIPVQVYDDCNRWPLSFMAVMAHELSHVLLATLRHPMAQSEFHADLVPLLLGFRGVIARGRTQHETTEDGFLKVETTTTFGYLSDTQYEWAKCRIWRELQRFRRQRRDVKSTVTHLLRRLNKARGQLGRFRAYLDDIDAHPSRKIRGRDASDLVRLHAPDYTRSWESFLPRETDRLEQLKAYVDPLEHYFDQHLRDCSGRVDAICPRVMELTQAVARDFRIVERHASVACRIRCVLRTS
jgi:hypothetical protein